MKRLIAALLLFVVVTVLVVACGGSSGGGGNTVTVHASGPSFAQTSVTLSKGSSLTIVDDDAAMHTIANGTWNNGVAQPMTEPGAPTVNVTLNGNDSQTVGPFNTTGTFHLYCSIHQNMNLTVIVS
jgi:plastocyanin